ncbi:hypothetical protein OC845_006223 [Tilletia horrida]|nr:hypothetical protein OC845_006223 [Tilletia horrida]
MDIGRRAGGPAPPYSPTPSYSNLPPPQPLPSPTLRHESSPDGMQEDYDMEPAVGERPPSLPPLAFMQPSISAVPSGPPSSSTRGGFRGGSAEAFRAASLRWDSASDAWQPDSSFDQPDYNALASSSSASILQRLQRCLFLPSRRRQASDAGPSSSLPFSERPTAQTSHDIDSQQYDEKNEKRCPGLFGWSKSMPDDNNDDDDQKSQRFHNPCSSSSALPPSYEVATGPSSSSSAIELDRSPTWQQQRRRQCVRLAMLLCFLLLIAVIIAGIVLLA